MSNGITRVEDMPVFQLAYHTALAIEARTRGFPGDFRWLRNQVLRSSESVCSNLVEGFYAQYTTEYLQSLHRCKREGRETILHLRYARDSVIAMENADLESQCEDVLNQLSNLILSLERKLQNFGKGKPYPGSNSGVVRELEIGYNRSLSWCPEGEEGPRGLPPSTINHQP